jgi:iron complex outermembrane receptor protein
MKHRILSKSIALVAAIQAAQAGAASILEEVIVTAQKREQAITDVALTVTAINGDVARAMGIQDTRGVAMITTNIDIKGSGMADANPSVTVRGIGMNNFNANNNPSVGIYLDEVFLATPAMINMSTMDVGRIEVLKGPQGTLYGRNATGGAINIISAKPTRELEGFASVSAAEYDTTKFEGAVSGPLTDTLAGRLSMLYNNQGESFHEYNRASGGRQDFEDSETKAVRGQLAGDFDRLSLNLNVSYMDQNLGNSPFTAIGGFWNSPDEVFAVPCQGALPDCVNTLGLDVSDQDGDPFTHDFQESRVGEMKIDSDVTSVNFKLDYDFDNVTLTSISAYIDQDRDFGENIWSTPLEFFAVVHEEEIEQYSQELRLSGEFNSIRWIGGGYYWYDTYKSDNLAHSADILGLLAGLNPLTWDVDQETTAYAAFTSVDWDFADRWMLTVGLRYSYEETDFKGGTNATVSDPDAFDAFLGEDLGLPQGITIPLSFIDDSIDDDQVDYRVALEFRPTDDILTYGSVTSGFKSGGFFGDFTFDSSELEPFDSETVTAYELGAKLTMADGKVQLNGAVFYYDYEDIQTFVPSAIGFKLANLEKAEISGAEIELLTSPLEGLDIRLGASYLDTDVDSKFAEFDGNDLPNSPETQFTGTARYEFPVSDAMHLAFQVDAKYSDESYRESTNNPWMQTDSYTVVNGRISLLSADGTWEVAAWGQNLTDEEYEQERFASDIIGMIVALQGNPRQYGVTFNYNF